MEKKLIVANWKENFTVAESQKWVESFGSQLSALSSQLEVIICPSFVLIPFLHSQLSPLTSRLSLGAQDVSKFEEGQYTGEVSAKMLKDFVKYVIVGHSERRRYFGETDEDVSRKVEQCLKYDLTPIVCVSNLEQASMSQPHFAKASRGKCVKESKKIVFAYEPVFAVGTGIPDTPENAQEFAQKIKSIISQNVRVLYGGSVNLENVKSFVSQPDISGVLVGQASLDPKELARIVEVTHLCVK